MDESILIETDGTIRFVYSDALAEVFDGEQMETRRASNVEPHPTKGWGWVAQMNPVDGPVLGANGTTIHRGFWPFADQHEIEAAWARLEPFKTRQAALDAERVWLRENLGL